jgi:hypothetical protein
MEAAMTKNFKRAARAAKQYIARTTGNCALCGWTFSPTATGRWCSCVLHGRRAKRWICSICEGEELALREQAVLTRINRLEYKLGRAYAELERLQKKGSV